MIISEDKAEILFNKGMIIWVYDDSGDMFYDADKTKPVETKWCKVTASGCIQADSWSQVKEVYKELEQNITRIEITTTTGKSWRN